MPDFPWHLGNDECTTFYSFPTRPSREPLPAVLHTHSPSSTSHLPPRTLTFYPLIGAWPQLAQTSSAFLNVSGLVCVFSRLVSCSSQYIYQYTHFQSLTQPNNTFSQMYPAFWKFVCWSWCSSVSRLVVYYQIRNSCIFSAYNGVFSVLLFVYFIAWPKKLL